MTYIANTPCPALDAEGGTARPASLSGQPIDGEPNATSHFLWLIGAFLGIAVIALSPAETGEVVELVALDEVVLVSPWRNFVPVVRPMAVLSAAQSVPVVSCSPRKTHTDIEVMFNGALRVWKGSYRLQRGPRGKFEPSAASSCYGLTVG